MILHNQIVKEYNLTLESERFRKGLLLGLKKDYLGDIYYISKRLNRNHAK